MVLHVSFVIYVRHLVVMLLMVSCFGLCFVLPNHLLMRSLYNGYDLRCTLRHSIQSHCAFVECAMGGVYALLFSIAVSPLAEIDLQRHFVDFTGTDPLFDGGGDSCTKPVLLFAREREQRTNLI